MTFLDFFSGNRDKLDGYELTLLYMILSVLIVIVVLIMAAHSGTKEAKRKKRERQDDSRLSSFGALESTQICCMSFVTDIMNRGFIYSAFLVHVWDQGSDIGVMYVWFTSDNGRWEYLAWLSIAILINYRIFSAFSLRKASRGWRDTIMQSMDLQIFVDVYRSSVEVKPTDSLYWIRAMEAVLESCFQILLQFVYLYEDSNVLVYLSLFGSLASVIFSLLHYTDVVFVFEAKKTIQSDDSDDDDDDEKHNGDHVADDLQNQQDGIVLWKSWFYSNASWALAYSIRFLFRAFEVTGRCMVLALIWDTLNDYNALTNETDYSGAIVVGLILLFELLFYVALTQLRIPPWELAAMLITHIDLTLTFEGREGATTRPLRHNIFYTTIYKPVSEMFTHVSKETERFYEAHGGHGVHHSKNTTNNMGSITSPRQKWNRNIENENEIKGSKDKRQKLLIAPAHYVWRFLESMFQLFCVATYAILNEEAKVKIVANSEVIVIATFCTILTPVFYGLTRTFADETRTLERNLIAMILTDDHGEDTEEIKRLIGAGAELKVSDYHGNTIVHAVVMKDNVTLMQRLIKTKKAPLDKPNIAGFTPVLLACKLGAIDCLKKLSHCDEINFNQRHNRTGQGLVHIAAENDQWKIIEFLHHLGNEKCSIHVKYDHVTSKNETITGYNACHVAARYNAPQAMKMAIEKGIDFHARIGNGDTCALLAAGRGYVVCLEVLHKAGYNFNERGNFGHTALYRACISNHSSTVKLLGSYKADPYIPDQNRVPVTLQCFKSKRFAVLGALAELGCRFDDKVVHYIDNENGDFLTPLMWSCENDQVSLAKTLLDSGCNKDHFNKYNETAAHYAAAHSLRCLQLLYHYSANLGIENARRKTPFQKAKDMHKHDVVEWCKKNKIS